MTSQPTIFSLLPLIISFILSLFISPLCASLIAITTAWIIFRKTTPLNKTVELFITGSSQHTIITMCYIFIFSSVFTYILQLIGGIQAAVTLGMAIIPSSYILPGFFIVVSLFALAIGSSMGAIAAFLPIGVGIAHTLGIHPAPLAAIVVNGSMLGDNLSIISDTTIAATQTTETSMKDKFRANIKLAIPAFLLTVITLTIQNYNLNTARYVPTTQTSIVSNVIKISPYLLVFALALSGIDVVAVLIAGIFMAMAIGIYYHVFSIKESSHLILRGFTQSNDIQEVLILVLFIAGLTYVVQYHGGIQYLLGWFKNIRNKAWAEGYIALLVFLVNAAIAINTIAILITGPLAKHIGDRFGIERKRIASLIDVTSCFCQGILPYAPQLLLASSLANISTFSIMPYLYYQWFIGLVTAASIIYNGYKK